MQLFVGFLLYFHCKLMNRGETTNEYLKQKSRDRNYLLREASWCKRLGLVLCRKSPPSLIFNDLIRISLLIEQTIETESVAAMSMGATPKRTTADQRSHHK